MTPRKPLVENAPPAPARPRWRVPALVGLGLAAAIGLLAAEITLTRPTRSSVATYTRLLDAANEGDLKAVRSLCTERYLRTHPIRKADEGGVVGLPRNIHKNFQVWRDGDAVLLCPTNRVGPVYRFVEEDGERKFDGPIGLLMPGGQVVPYEDQAASEPG